MHEDLPDRGCFSHRDDAERLMQLFPLLRLRKCRFEMRLRSDIHIACRARPQLTTRSAALQVLEQVPRRQRCMDAVKPLTMFVARTRLTPPIEEPDRMH